jgi:hypothetical protein
MRRAASLGSLSPLGPNTGHRPQHREIQPIRNTRLAEVAGVRIRFRLTNTHRGQVPNGSPAGGAALVHEQAQRQANAPLYRALRRRTRRCTRPGLDARAGSCTSSGNGANTGCTIGSP